MLAKMKSANALSGLMLNWLRFLGLLCIRKHTVWREREKNMKSQNLNRMHIDNTAFSHSGAVAQDYNIHPP